MGGVADLVLNMISIKGVFMKIRNGFVSNSSSSSFVLKANDKIGETFLSFHKYTSLIISEMRTQKLITANFELRFELIFESVHALKKKFNYFSLAKIYREVICLENVLKDSVANSAKSLPFIATMLKDVASDSVTLTDYIDSLDFSKSNAKAYLTIEKLLKSIRNHTLNRKPLDNGEHLYCCDCDNWSHEIINSFEYFAEKKHITIVSKK